METSKCPRCNATIEKDVTICGNCKVQLSWKTGEPLVEIPVIDTISGCAEATSSLGCLLTLFLTIPILLGVCSIV